MRVFITGIAGFIGYHVARALAQQGVAVAGLDDFNGYYDPSLKHARAALLQKHGVPVTAASLSDGAALARLVDDAGATHLLHLAAQAGVRHSVSHPHAYVEANIVGFLNVLELCRRRPALRLVYASSSSVYGNSEELPWAVAARSDSPASFYGVTKKCNELMAYSYHSMFGVGSVGLRFFTVYGPWGRPDMAYYSFADKIMRGEPLTLFDGGALLRDFTYVDDIVDGIKASLRHASGRCELFNLGNSNPVPVTALVQALEQALGRRALTVAAPMQTGDVRATYADIEESRRLLGFEPKVSLQEGIGRFAAWYRQWTAERPSAPVVK